MPEVGRRGRIGNHGSIDNGLKAADKTLQATYTIAYIAHCPMEPRVAVAEWTDGGVTIWTGSPVSTLSVIISQIASRSS